MDIEDISKGLIPWDKRGFQLVNSKLTKLLNTPKDDWDLSSDFSFLKDDVAENIFKANPFAPMGQIARFMQKMYSDKRTFMAHFFRYNNIIRFLKEYEEGLCREGFIRRDANNHMIKDELLETLCMLPFSETRESYGEVEEYGFSYNEVVEKAWEMFRRRKE